MPKEDQLPISLKYAASINLLFSGIKLKDNVADKSSFIGRTADKAFSAQMAQAEQQLHDWGLDLEKLNYWLKIHAARELEPPEFRRKIPTPPFRSRR